MPLRRPLALLAVAVLLFPSPALGATSRSVSEVATYNVVVNGAKLEDSVFGQSFTATVSGTGAPSISNISPVYPRRYCPLNSTTCKDWVLAGSPSVVKKDGFFGLASTTSVTTTFTKTLVASSSCSTTRTLTIGVEINRDFTIATKSATTSGSGCWLKVSVGWPVVTVK